LFSAGLYGRSILQVESPSALAKFYREYNYVATIDGFAEPGIAAERTVIYAGDYINKLSGEQLEYECRRRLEQGCQEIELNFSKTELINSIGISIILGVIDSASNSGARVVLSQVNEDTLEIFNMLGVNKHVTIA
jgi:anti-anti-sigma regulatory factor